ncbi:MAG TPA: GNAT family protein [Bacteroidota bacterium]
MKTGTTQNHLLSRALAVLREEGFINFWYRTLAYTVYRRAFYFELIIAEHPHVSHASPQITVSLLTPEYIEEYLILHPEEYLENVRARLAAGGQCFVVRQNGRIVHSGWAAVRNVWITHLSKEITLAPDEVYTYESYTDPAFRGHDMALKKNEYMRHFFGNAGYRRLTGIVTPENKAGLRAINKIGYKPIGIFKQFRVGPWRYDSWVDLTPASIRHYPELKLWHSEQDDRS